MFLSIILVVIFLSILVVVHEIGHFLAAKKFGLWVEEFGIGLPPRVWGKKIGETIYSVNALPVGGFVKIFGEDPQEKEAAISEQEKITELIVEEKILETEEGWEIEDKITSQTTIVSDKSRSFAGLAVWRRAIIIVAGVIMNFIFGWFLVSVVFMIGIPRTIVVTEVVPQSPAEAIGLAPGDQIVGVESPLGNLKQNFGAEEFTGLINKSKGKEIILEIYHQGKTVTEKVTPRINPPADQGALGIGLVEGGIQKLPFFESIWQGLTTSWQVVVAIFSVVWGLISKAFVGKANFNGITGPVGIVKITTEASKMGLVYLLQLIALISLNLAVINIFPFPALDGGRLLFLIFEKIKGSPLPQKFEKYANAIGMALLLFLVAVIAIKDVINLF